MLTGLRFSDRFDILLKIITMRINNRERSFIHSKKGKKKKKEARVRLFPSTISTLFSFFFFRDIRRSSTHDFTNYSKRQLIVRHREQLSIIETSLSLTQRLQLKLVVIGNFSSFLSILFLYSFWMTFECLTYERKKEGNVKGHEKKKRSSKKLYSFVKR